MSFNRTACSTPDVEELGIDLGRQFPPPRPNAALAFAPTPVSQAKPMATQAHFTLVDGTSRFSDYEWDGSSTLNHEAYHNPEPRALEEGKSSLKGKAASRLTVLLKLGGRTKTKLVKNNNAKAEIVCQCGHSKQKRRKRRLYAIILIIFLIYALANLIFLNIRIIPLSSGSAASTLTSLEEACLTQFQINAPSNASSYPCSTCLAILQGISSDSLSSLSTSDQQAVSNGLQFCGLQSIYTAAAGSAQAALANSGWAQDVQFCTWGGVTCNADGQISFLKMTFPAVPSVLSDGIGALTSMQSLQIVGGDGIPAGSVPGGLANLTSLTSLDLESTDLTDLVLNGTLGSLTSLTLTKNSAMELSIPNIDGLKLQSLVVDNQTFPLSLSDLLNSTTLRSSLKTLSLTSVELNAAIPSSISAFTALTELHLDSDGLQGPLPSVLPSSLQILTLSDNPSLGSATLPSALCTSTTLQTCTLSDDGFANTSQGACGVCTF